MRTALALASVALLALAAPAAAREVEVAPRARAAQDTPVCKKCQSAGRLPCPEHEKDLCALEDELIFCGVIADCGLCSGAGFVPCKDCDNQPVRARLEEKKRQVATRRVALEGLDKKMGRALRKGESAHFILVWEMERLKVGKKWLESHALLHLYLQRLEEAYQDYLGRLQITDQEFVEKLKVFVWQFPQDQLDGSLRFCKQGATGGVKLMGDNPSYSVCGNKQNFQDDEKLHRNIVHCVAHLLLSAQKPVAWIGNLKAGWADEGLAHYFEERRWGVCDTYCFQEANTNVDFKGGRFRLAVRRLVEEKTCPPVAEVFDQNIDTLTLPMHAVSFSYVDFLIARDAPRFNELMKRLKAKLPTRDALKEVFGLSPLDFEGLWKSWVLQTYPTK